MPVMATSVRRPSTPAHRRGGCQTRPMPADERIEVTRPVTAPPEEVFALLCDPQGHVAIDASGMLQDADGEPVTAVGQSFVVHMDR